MGDFGIWNAGRFGVQRCFAVLIPPVLIPPVLIPVILILVGVSLVPIADGSARAETLEPVRLRLEVGRHHDSLLNRILQTGAPVGIRFGSIARMMVRSYGPERCSFAGNGFFDDVSVESLKGKTIPNFFKARLSADGAIVSTETGMWPSAFAPYIGFTLSVSGHPIGCGTAERQAPKSGETVYMVRNYKETTRARPFRLFIKSLPPESRLVAADGTEITDAGTWLLFQHRNGIRFEPAAPVGTHHCTVVPPALQCALQRQPEKDGHYRIDLLLPDGADATPVEAGLSILETKAPGDVAGSPEARVEGPVEGRAPGDGAAFRSGGRTGHALPEIELVIRNMVTQRPSPILRFFSATREKGVWHLEAPLAPLVDGTARQDIQADRHVTLFLPRRGSAVFAAFADRTAAAAIRRRTDPETAGNAADRRPEGNGPRRSLPGTFRPDAYPEGSRPGG